MAHHGARRQGKGRQGERGRGAGRRERGKGVEAGGARRGEGAGEGGEAGGGARGGGARGRGGRGRFRVGLGELTFTWRGEMTRGCLSAWMVNCLDCLLTLDSQPTQSFSISENPDIFGNSGNASISSTVQAKMAGIVGCVTFRYL